SCEDNLKRKQSQRDSSGELTMRLGLRYVKGLREESGQAIVKARAQGPFLSIDDLQNRVPELRKDEMRKLAAGGAVHFFKSRTGIPACPISRQSLAKKGVKTIPKQDRQECLSYINRR